MNTLGSGLHEHVHAMERSQHLLSLDHPLVDQIAKGIVEGEEVADEIRATRERRKAIEAELAEQPLSEKTANFLPAAMSDLHEAFHAGGVTGIIESAGFIREILSSATLFRKEDGTGVVVEVKGYLNGLLTW